MKIASRSPVWDVSLYTYILRDLAEMKEEKEKEKINAASKSHLYQDDKEVAKDANE